MDKTNRFTDEAFKKVTDKKVIEEAKTRAEQLKATPAPRPDNKKIS